MKNIIVGLLCAALNVAMLLIAIGGGWGAIGDTVFAISAFPFVHLQRVDVVSSFLRAFGRDSLDVAVVLNVALWGLVGWWISSRTIKGARMVKGIKG